MNYLNHNSILNFLCFCLLFYFIFIALFLLLRKLIHSFLPLFGGGNMVVYLCLVNVGKHLFLTILQLRQQINQLKLF
jgi:hypothetical protein